MHHKIEVVTKGLATLAFIVLLAGCQSLPKPTDESGEITQLKDTPLSPEARRMNTPFTADVEPVSPAQKPESDNVANTDLNTIDPKLPDQAASDIKLTQPSLSTEQLQSLAEAQSELRAEKATFWGLLRDRFTLNHAVNSKKVDAYRRAYLKHPASLYKMLKRGEPYFYNIMRQVNERQLPGELVLLPVVESGYDPLAHSHGGAAGIWQFIASTGKLYSLKQNQWYDGRRDVQASTVAALNYLTKLNKQFKGNWLHALASYNAGAGRVSRSMQRNAKQGKATDYWSLRLPEETRGYVPKLIAIAQIIDNPEHYNIKLPEIPLFDPMVKVPVAGQIALDKAAELAGMTQADIYHYNPAFKRWATDPEGPHHLMVPYQHASTLQDNLENLSNEELLGVTRYTVKSGDTLSGIARRHRIRVSALKTANQLTSNRLQAGSRLLIPRTSTHVHGGGDKAAQLLVKAPEGRRKIRYKVKNGDSFWGISQRFNVTIKNIVRWNRLDPTRHIRPGDLLTMFVNARTL